MEGSKPWYESKAVWGGVVALASPIAAAIGHRMEPADQAHLVDAIVQLAAAVGGILAIVGRIRAHQTIGR